MTKRIDRTTRHLFAAILLTLAAFTPVFSQFSANAPTESPLPAPTGHVNDYAGVIDATTKGSIEEKLRAFKAAKGVEIAVAVVKTTGDRPIAEYSLAVARGWGIGSKADDNPSALLFVAIDDRRYFTQVSRDLEDELPDGVVGSLQRQFLVPEFKKGNYAKGISDTVDAYLYTVEQKLSGSSAQPPTATGTTEEGGVPIFSIFCCLVIILVIVLIIWANKGGGGKSRQDKDRWGGGFGGGGSALPWIFVGGSGGSSGGSSDWGSSGGGSDWGGFGGGGDFGGGGAGGDW